MFVAWAATADLIGELHTDEDPELIASLLDRSLTPGAWFIAACDEKFTTEDLSAEGNAFAQSYYVETEGSQGSRPTYLKDYSEIFAEYEDVYRVPDDWASFDRLRPMLDRRLMAWKSPSPTGWRRLFQ
jgi:hypothetical protein